MAVVVLCAIGAPSARAADSCPNAAYRKGPAASLPDCRAWEQITPVEKGGNSPLSLYGTVSPDGDRVSFSSAGNTGNASQAQPLNSYFTSTRSSAWSTVGVDPPADEPITAFVLFISTTLGFSPDQSKALVVSTHKLTPDAVEGATNLYVRDTATRSFLLAVSVQGKALYNEYTHGTLPLYGANADFSRLVVVVPPSTVPGDADGGLYEIGGGAMRKLNPDANGTPMPFTGAGSEYASAGQPLVSNDGRRVLFGANPGLFQRIDGSSTASIARSHRAGEPATPVNIATGGAWASPDGTRVIFASADPTTPLTDDGPAPFYRWTATGGDGTLTSLLAGVPRPWSANSGNFQILRVSPDGRYVWFSYSDFDAQAQRIAVLDTSARAVTNKALFEGPNYNYLPAPSNIRYSQDGKRLLILTQASLSSYDQTGSQCSGGTAPCAEAFLLDATAATAPPRCLSCGPAGTHSVGDARIGSSNSQFPFPVAPVITDDGRVVFDTPQRLAAGDGNSVADVYQYTPSRGTALITSGTSFSPATVTGTTASGRDVVFATDESLLASDTDTDTDYYDARTGGGIAAQQAAPATAGSCPAGDCPGAQAAAPAAEAPATAFFRGLPSEPRFRVARVSTSAKRRATRSGRLEITATVGSAGRLSARAAAGIGGRSRAIGRASLSARRAGRYTLSVRLSRSARRQLARERKLRIALSVSFSRASEPSRQSVVLVAPRPRSSGKGGPR